MIIVVSNDGLSFSQRRQVCCHTLMTLCFVQSEPDGAHSYVSLRYISSREKWLLTGVKQFVVGKCTVIAHRNVVAILSSSRSQDTARVTSIFELVIRNNESRPRGQQEELG